MPEDKKVFKIPEAPFDRLLGLEIIRLDKDFAFVKLAFRKDLTNPHNALHGGVIASLADSASAIALTTRFKEGNFFTVRSNIKFKGLAKTDVFAEARITNIRKKFHFIKIKIFDSSNNTVAEAENTFFVTK